jgi:hypothetical protein
MTHYSCYDVACHLASRHVITRTPVLKTTQNTHRVDEDIKIPTLSEQSQGL